MITILLAREVVVGLLRVVLAQVDIFGFPFLVVTGYHCEMDETGMFNIMKVLPIYC